MFKLRLTLLVAIVSMVTLIPASTAAAQTLPTNPAYESWLAQLNHPTTCRFDTGPISFNEGSELGVPYGGVIIYEHRLDYDAGFSRMFIGVLDRHYHYNIPLPERGPNFYGDLQPAYESTGVFVVKNFDYQGNGYSYVGCTTGEIDELVLTHGHRVHETTGLEVRFWSYLPSWMLPKSRLEEHLVSYDDCERDRQELSLTKGQLVVPDVHGMEIIRYDGSSWDCCWEFAFVHHVGRFNLDEARGYQLRGCQTPDSYRELLVAHEVTSGYKRLRVEDVVVPTIFLPRAELAR